MGGGGSFVIQLQVGFMTTVVGKKSHRQHTFVDVSHCILLTPYGNLNLGHHWFRQWLVAWWHQAITWTNDAYHQWGSWHSSESNFTMSTQGSILYNELENRIFKITAIFVSDGPMRSMIHNEWRSYVLLLLLCQANPSLDCSSQCARNIHFVLHIKCIYWYI